MLTQELTFQILNSLHTNPARSQRAIAEEVGISLGRVNFCLKAFVSTGFVKVRNFYNSKNKKGYIYVLTPKGIEERAKLTFIFLDEKLDEYKKLQTEIEALKREVQVLRNNSNFDLSNRESKDAV